MEDDRRIGNELSLSILLAEQVRAAIDAAESFKAECAEMGKQVELLSQMFRTLVRLSAASQSLYDRPIRRVIAEANKNLQRALVLARKCKRQSIIRRVCTITNAADFRKVANLLDSSNGDVKWLLSVFDPDVDGGYGVGIDITLPPIATNDPILPWVWSLIASIQTARLPDRIEAANQLSSLAKDNERNKKIIVEECGIPPLLRLLKESASPDAQIAAIIALTFLASDPDRARAIVNEHGVQTVLQVLSDSPIRVQTKAASLVARMAEHDALAQDEFARQGVIRPLVTLLSLDMFVDDHWMQFGKQSLHSIAQINKELEKTPAAASKLYRPYTNSYSSLSHESSSMKFGLHRKERENESPEVKLQLKISCSEALWMLAKGSELNSRRITETKGLLCLAKLVESDEGGELQYNSLMTVMEITSAAECNADLRRSAFKTNSPAAKAVVDQLLRLIKESEAPLLQVPAIRAIGCLARTFPARETTVIISPLVTKLGSNHQDVALEAVISLQKFASPDNFLCTQHSKTIIELGGVPLLLKFIRGSEPKTQLQSLVMLCYLALHASDDQGLEQAKVLTALEGAERVVVSQNLEFKDLVGRAIYHLSLYDSRIHCQIQPY